MEAAKVTAIILAAGLSKRMGANKLLLPWRNGTLLGHVLKLTAGFGFGRNILVTRPETAENTEIPPCFEVIINPNPEVGQSLSLRLGTEAASGRGYLYFTGDQPLLDAATITMVLQAANDENIVAPRAGDRPGGPVFFAERFRQALLAVTGDAGGRAVYRDHSESLTLVDVPDAEALADADTPEEYQRLLALEQSRTSG